MKKQLFLSAILFALVATGCTTTPSSSATSTTSSESTSSETTSSVSSSSELTSSSTSSITSSSSSSSSSSNSSSSSSSSSEVPPPIILGGQIEEALKKDYKNMSVNFYLNSMEYGQEYGYEYYLGGSDFVAVLDGTTAELYGLDTAWSFYSYYNNKSYAYWDASYYVTKGWISNGSHGIGVGIDYAYFYMPYLLQRLTKDDVTNVMGAYVVKDTSLDKINQGLKFAWLTNDIHYIDIKVNEQGYISRIRGFDDPNNDEYGFQIELSNFGTCTAPQGVTLPPAINESNIKTYADMLGHEEEPDIYITSLSININDPVNSDEDYQIIMDPDDVVDLSFSYLPANANKREVNWHTTDDTVAELLYSHESGHQYLRAVSEGETYIYVTHVDGDKKTISSDLLRVKVNPGKTVEQTAEDVYRFKFTGSEGTDGAYTVNATNQIANSQAPYSITTWRMQTRTGNYSDNFADDDVVLYSAPNSSTNFSTRFEDEVLFDFSNQQVSKMSFAYALFRCNSKANLNMLESITIYTSNDANTWESIDVTEEMRAEFDKASLSTGMTPKILTKTFEPASMVKIIITAKSVGGNDLGIGMKDFVFARNEYCHNFDDVEAVPVTNITISAPKNRLKIGTSMKMSAVITPDNASNPNVRWTSSDTDVLTVDARTGFVTAVGEGVATVKAVSTSNPNMVSNEIVITTYNQDTIVDENNLFVGKTFFASGVTYGVNTADVTFTVKDSKTASLTISISVMGQEFKNVINVTFNTYDEVSGIYEFESEDGAIVNVTLANDGSYVNLTYKTSDSDVFTNIVLNKVK